MSVLDILFPKFCCGCHKIGTFLCDKCQEKIYYLPLPLSLKLRQSFLDTTVAMAEYEEPLKSLIHQLKYEHVKELGTVCGQFLFNATHWPDADLVTCTPLHNQRKNERGFNQTEIIAQQFSLLSHIPFRQLLIKNHHTVAQATLIDKSHRLTNLETAFAINPRYEFSQNIPDSVLLIDDVITTGTTLNTCAKVLKDWGVKHVHGLAVAHGF